MLERPPRRLSANAMSCTLIGIYWLVAGLVIGMVVGTLIAKGEDDD